MNIKQRKVVFKYFLTRPWYAEVWHLAHKNTFYWIFEDRDKCMYRFLFQVVFRRKKMSSLKRNQNVVDPLGAIF